MSVPVLHAEGLGKRFTMEIPEQRSLALALQRWLSGGGPRRPVWALRDASFAVARGECVGLIGPNGAGKSTLLSLAAGLLEPSEGRLRVEGRAQPFFQMGAGLHPRLSVEEGLRLSAALLDVRGAQEAVVESALAFSGLGSYRRARIGELSTGLAARIPFSAALHAELDVLLIDEMFAVGDAVFRAKCLDAMRRLRGEGKTFLLATHDLELVRSFCPRTLYLEAGRLVFDGETGEALRRYAESSRAARSMGDGAEEALLRYLEAAKRLAPRVAARWGLEEAAPAGDETLREAHTAAWLARVDANDLSPEEERLWGLPLSREVLGRARRAAGATLQACRKALDGGLGVTLFGGMLHAGPERGEEHCPVNDAAAALKTLLREGRVRRPMLVDLDAHQGHGAARILRGEERLFTFYLFNAAAYPPIKEPASLNVPLPPGSGDAEVLAELERQLPRALDEHRPDLVLCNLSADPFEGDPLGGLRMSEEGLARRDRFVLRALAERRVPTALTLGGGYAAPEALVRIRERTLEAAFEAFPSAPKVVII